MLQVTDGFPYYIEFTKDKSLYQLLNSHDNFSFLQTITEEKASDAYAEGKWTIKEIVGHVTDHERIMTYRALRFSRKDTTVLPGYDQEMFVKNSRFNEMSFKELVVDFINVRTATKSFYKSLSLEQLDLKGTAWKYELTVEDTLRATVGHEMHHIGIIKERYLK